MKSLLSSIHQIHDCLNIVCDVESNVFDSSFTGLFKRKDYVGNNVKMLLVRHSLLEIVESLIGYDALKAEINTVAENAKDYAYALDCSTAQLIFINEKLAGKANGQKYSMGDYNTEFKKFQALQQRYMSLGSKLNASFHMYSFEISQLEE